MAIERVSTGVDGLDEILGGGLPKNHAYLLQGEAGTGKTTMAFQFLLAGASRGEKALYISILQSRRDLEEMAESHGWDMKKISLEILVDQAVSDSRLNEQTLLPSAEVQLNKVMDSVREAVERIRPDLVVFDSIEQFRLIAGERVVYQQKNMMLLRLFEKMQTTALFIHTTEEKAGFKTLVHGVINQQTELPSMGGLRRYINVEKMRGAAFKGGKYSYRIVKGGVIVYPPLPVDTESADKLGGRLVSSGNDELDTLLGGGLSEGTACLLAGASGTGKSSIATIYAYESANRGERAVIFVFDERASTVKERARGMGIDLDRFIEEGLIRIIQINIGDFAVGELAHIIREEVEERSTRVVVIDSISGYYIAMPGEPQLTAHLHEILSYLGEKQVLSLLVLTEHGLFSEEKSEVDVSYLSDTVVVLRRFEARGEIRLAISVVKKRIGGHEKAIRELQITDHGIDVGEPLHAFEGILTGHPRYTGGTNGLMG